MNIYQEILSDKVNAYIDDDDPDLYDQHDRKLLFLTCCNFPGIDDLIADDSSLVNDLIGNASAYLFGGCNGFSDQCKPESQRISPDLLTVLDSALYMAADMAAKQIKES